MNFKKLDAFIDSALEPKSVRARIRLRTDWATEDLARAYAEAKVDPELAKRRSAEVIKFVEDTLESKKVERTKKYLRDLLAPFSDIKSAATIGEIKELVPVLDFYKDLNVGQYEELRQAPILIRKPGPIHVGESFACVGIVVPVPNNLFGCSLPAELTGLSRSIDCYVEFPMDLMEDLTKKIIGCKRAIVLPENPNEKFTKPFLATVIHEARHYLDMSEKPEIFSARQRVQDREKNADVYVEKFQKKYTDRLQALVNQPTCQRYFQDMVKYTKTETNRVQNLLDYLAYRLAESDQQAFLYFRSEVESRAYTAEVGFLKQQRMTLEEILKDVLQHQIATAKQQSQEPNILEYVGILPIMRDLYEELYNRSPEKK